MVRVRHQEQQAQRPGRARPATKATGAGSRTAPARPDLPPPRQLQQQQLRRRGTEARLADEALFVLGDPPEHEPLEARLRRTARGEHQACAPGGKPGQGTGRSLASAQAPRTNAGRCGRPSSAHSTRQDSSASRQSVCLKNHPGAGSSRATKRRAEAGGEGSHRAKVSCLPPGRAPR